MAKKIFFNGPSSTNLKSRVLMIPTVSRAPFTSTEWVYFYHNGVINSKNKQILPSKSISSSISKSSLIIFLLFSFKTQINIVLTDLLQKFGCILRLGQFGENVSIY